MLSGSWVGHWVCHIRSDWLLIYKLTDEVMVLTLVRWRRTAICLMNSRQVLNPISHVLAEALRA
jgi:hypothetical protein